MHYIICLPFNYFCYVKFVQENISTNVTVPTQSMQLSMWFSNVKTIHILHSTHITVQFQNPVILWRILYKMVGECFSNVFRSNILFQKHVKNYDRTDLIQVLVFKNISTNVTEPTESM